MLRPGSHDDMPVKMPRKISTAELEAMAKRVILPSLPVSDEEMTRAKHHDTGLRLARQDRWEELATRIKKADADRRCTPGGEPAALLLAHGARSDVVAAVEDKLASGVAPARDGIEALEDVLDDYPDCYASALVVALAHTDIAWAWQAATRNQPPEKALGRAQGHLQRASTILAPFDGVKLDAPSVLAAQCALDTPNERHGARLVDTYGRLIKMDPESHRHMRALGRHLAVQLQDKPNMLEVEARRTAAFTQAIWGAGGYAWVYHDALMLDPTALDMLETEFFIEGMRDILGRKSDQHLVNLFAAFCAITMAPRDRDIPLSRAAEEASAQIHACLNWIVADHMQELHPVIWSQTLLAPGNMANLPSRRVLVENGREAALRIIARHFARDIIDGSSIAFSPQGMYRLPAL